MATMREEFEQAFEAPTGCYWHSPNGEYFQQWPELEGDERLDAEIEKYNAMYLAWQASRASLVIELPHEVSHVTSKEFEAGRDAVIMAIESKGLTVK